MTATIPDIAADKWLRWRTFVHSDSAELYDLWQVGPEEVELASNVDRWPGADSALPSRPEPWSCVLDLRGSPSQHALSIVTAYNPGPPVNHQGQYEDAAELASMTGRAWRIQWETPWAGGGNADYNDAYTYAWEVVPDLGHGWTVGVVGVFPSVEVGGT